MNKRTIIKFAIGQMAFVVCLGVGASAQTTGGDGAVSANKPKTTPPATAATKAIRTPAMTEFRKASIGILADDLKKAWGKPEIEDKTGFIYNFSDTEMAQVVITPDEKVDAIAVTFRDGTGAPKAEDVFGPKEKIERKENGSVFHMVRYEDAGYWVSYLSQGEGKPVILTYKKL
jgi:hypothetical protein